LLPFGFFAFTLIGVEGASGDAGPAKSVHGPVLLLSVEQAAQALGIGRSTLYELIAAGEVETVHIGRSCRVPLEAYTSSSPSCVPDRCWIP
jgi:excisionase family DNA binding protein